MNFRQLLQEFQKQLLKEYWGKMGAGVLVYAQDVNKFLVSFRSPKVASGLTWGVIGGAVKGVDGEKDLSPERGAKTELCEEAGYCGSFLSFKPLYVFRDGDFQYHTFLGVVSKAFSPVSKREHAWENLYFEWFSLEDLIGLNDKHFGLEKMLKDGGVISTLETISSGKSKKN